MRNKNLLKMACASVALFTILTVSTQAQNAQAPGPNLALNMPASAAWYDFYGMPANANDGSLGTEWYGDPYSAMNSWLVDLLANNNLTQIRFVSTQYHPVGQWSIQVATDGGGW